jgi:hypothetical protein
MPRLQAKPLPVFGSPQKQKSPANAGLFTVFGGEQGIRTLETLLTFAGFQDYRFYIKQ